MITKESEYCFRKRSPYCGLTLVQPVCMFYDRFHKVAQTTLGLLIFFLIFFLEYNFIYGESVSIKKRSTSELPIIFLNRPDLYRMNDIDEFEYLRKYYNINTLLSFTWDMYPTIENKWSISLENLKKRGFYRIFIQSGSDNPEIIREAFEHEDKGNWEQRIPYTSDENGNVLKNNYFDRMSPRYYSNYIRPAADIAAKYCDIFQTVEYFFNSIGYSDDDIAQFQKDLSNEDEGIDWLFYDGRINHLNFWEYANARLGVSADDFPSQSLGNFISYKEYRPEKDLARSQVQDWNKYVANRFIFRQLLEYEYFKLLQKWHKLAKEKGMKYCAYGRNNWVYRDINHEPYVDYIGVGTSGPRDSMVPGAGAGAGLWTLPERAPSIFDLRWAHRYYGVLNDELGKANLVACETVIPGRNPVAFYKDQFSALLFYTTVLKPRYFYPEFSVSETVFDTGLSESLRAYNLSIIDAWSQAINSGLNTGRILRSNWLIQTDPDVFGFGWHHGYEINTNLGDMRTELFLDGYMFDIEPGNGADRLPMDKYKVITMGGKYFSDRVIEDLKKWRTEGKGKTLFINYKYFGTNFREQFIGKRYTDLGIWKTDDITEYDVNEVTWVDTSIIPNVRPGKYSLKAVAPANEIMSNLPQNAKVLMKGKTTTGVEVPLIIIYKYDNTIINITFALDSTREYDLPEASTDEDDKLSMDEIVQLEEWEKIYRSAVTPELKLCKNTMLGLFEYIQKENKFFISRVKCNYSMYDVYRSASLDNKGIGTVCAYGQERKGEGTNPLRDPIVLEYENHKVVSKMNGRSVVIASLDGSVLSSLSHINVDGTIYVKEIEPESLYLLVAIDGKSYNNSKLFHLWTQKSSSITFLKPSAWSEKNKIKIYNFDEASPIEMPFKLTKEYITFKTEARKEYKISYGEIDKSQWDIFCKRLNPESKEQSRFDDSNWEKLILNSNNKTLNGTESGWLRLHFKVPESWKGNSLVLDAGLYIYNTIDITYFNGENIGRTTDAFGLEHIEDVPRRYIIPKHIIKNKTDNVIAIKMCNLRGSGPRGVSYIFGGSVRLINPAKGEDIDIAGMEWLYKEDKEIGSRKWSAY